MEIHQNLLERARCLAPVFKERAIEAEKERHVPLQTVQDLIESGILRIIIPQRFGGYQLDWETLMGALMELAKGDGSQAWVAAVYSIHALDISMFPEKAQREVWASDLDPIVISAVAPSGTGNIVPGGATISGKWSFASGVRFAEWGIIGGMLNDGRNPPAHHLCLVKKEQWKVDDNWNVMGLKGTGSADIKVEDIFIPDHRIITRVEQRDGTAKGTQTHKDKIYSTPYLTIAPAALAAVVVGCAAGGVEEFIEFAKHSSQRGVKLCERESIQLRVAESTAEIDCAKLLIERLAQTTTHKMRACGSLSIEDRAQARRDTAYACTLAKRSIERLFDVSGANGLYTEKHFQRYYRDVKAGSNHIAIGWDRCGATYGRVILGLEPGLDEI
jgi:3-hydroxy-9,10-secoandrosta-1,3,5(10)-triene-9,17-dione monooxygenase